MQRLIIVYNPLSTRARKINEEVLADVRKLRGVMVGKFEVGKTTIVENARRLEGMLSDGDIVVTAGGDGTTEVGVNALCMSNKDVRLGILPYGNFNDVARGFGLKSLGEVLMAKEEEVYPIEVKVNGGHYQYTMGYFTVGMFAMATEVFERKKVRERLKRHDGNLIFSIWMLAGWYFKNRRRAKLPIFRMDGREMKGVTDVLVVNGRTAAKVMRGGEYYYGRKMLVGVGRLSNLVSLGIFMMRSMLGRIPGEEMGGVKLVFEKEAVVTMQAEGEYEKLEGVREMEFLKEGRGIKVLRRG
ncbi:hypothetical protein IJ096_02455 [Candidatus Saccharibacteria bacterium]|nr:hypothetical protein [Candidatus Saccharibacteria bacterium]